MVTLARDKNKHVENRGGALNINEVAYLLSIDNKAVETWVNAGILKAFPTTHSSKPKFSREEIANLLYRLGV